MTVSPIALQVASNALQPHSLPWSYHLSQKVSDAVHSRWSMGIVALAGIVGACYSVATGVVAGLISFAIACAAQKPSLDQLEEALSNKNFARVQYILEAHQGNPNVTQEFILTKFKSFVETILHGSEPSFCTFFEYLLNHPALKKWKPCSETIEILMRKAIEQKNISLGVAIWKKAANEECRTKLFIMILDHQDLSTINAFLSSPFFEEVISLISNHDRNIPPKIQQIALRFIQKNDFASLDVFLSKTASLLARVVNSTKDFFAENIFTTKNAKLIEIFLSHFSTSTLTSLIAGRETINTIIDSIPENSLGVISHILYPMTCYDENSDTPWFQYSSKSEAKELYDFYKKFSDFLDLNNDEKEADQKSAINISFDLLSWVSKSKEHQLLAPQILKNILHAISKKYTKIKPQLIEHLLKEWKPFFSSSDYKRLMGFLFWDKIEIDLAPLVLNHLQQLPDNLRTDIIFNHLKARVEFSNVLSGFPNFQKILKHLKEKRFLNSLQASHIYKFLEIKFQNPRIALQESILPYLIKELPDAQKSFVSAWIQEKEEERPDNSLSAFLRGLREALSEQPSTIPDEPLIVVPLAVGRRSA